MRRGEPSFASRASNSLETHYQPQRSQLGPQHQPFALGRAAAAGLLSFLGFGAVTRGDNETVTAASPDRVPGYILSRFVDIYGRAIAFAFPGDHPQPDGDDVFLDEALLRQSANEHLLTLGLVYPTFYSNLYVDIRGLMTVAAQQARGQGIGVWADDATNAGSALTRSDDLSERVIILPKLYRRLLDYLALNDGDLSLSGFRGYVEQRNDRMVILPAGQVTGFDFVIEVQGQRVRLTVPPENLVFMEGRPIELPSM